MVLKETCEERDELIAGPVHPKSDGDGAEAANGVESDLDIVILQFINKNRNWLEALVVTPADVENVVREGFGSDPYTPSRILCVASMP